MSANDQEHLKIFAASAGEHLAREMCDHLDMSLGKGRAIQFPDGEIIVKLEDDVRGRDCYIVQSTCEPVNDNLMELLIWIDCLRRASAGRITAVIPYFGYARQDRKDEGRVPITAKLVANLVTAAGADRVLCLDLHAAQIQGFFDIPVDHMSAGPVLAEYFMKERDAFGKIAVVSPDVGNVRVANMFANGATDVIAAATHGVFVGMAQERIMESPISKVIVTDTISCANRCEPIKDKLVELSVAKLLGEAIHRIHHDQSISAMFRTLVGTKR